MTKSGRWFNEMLAGLTMLVAGTAMAQETVRIGAPFEATGKLATYGAQGQRGLEMAVDAVGGKAAGRKIEVLSRDIQSSNQGTVSAFTDLIEGQKVDFIIGPVASGLVAAAVPAWRQQKPLWIVPGSSAPTFEDAIAKEPMVFHTYPWAYHYHEDVAKALGAALGRGKKAAIVYSDGSYGRSQVQTAKENLAEQGFTVVASEVVRENANDMSPVLQKIAVSKPDVLVAILQTTDGIVLAKQLFIAKLAIPYLVGTAFPQLDTWAAASGEAAAGWIGATTYLPGMARPADPKYPKLFPAAKEWEAAFRTRYKREPEFLDVTVYTSAVMLFVAMDEANSVDKTKVAEKLKHLGVQTMLGSGDFQPTKGGAVNQAFAQMLVYQRQGDKLVTVWPADVASGKIAPNATR